MKIAILLFGQPRFFDVTKDLIKKEFDFPDHEVDYFAHFWDNVGYIPKGEEDKIEKNQLKDLVSSSLPNLRRIVINNYTDSGFHEFCEHMNYFGKLHRRPVPFKSDTEAYYYKFGQHWSIKKCYNEICSYELANKFKYDIIIKARTDIVYMVPECYASEDDYIEDKNKFYFEINQNRPTIKSGALRFLDLRKKIDQEFNNPNTLNTVEGVNLAISSFYNNKYQYQREKDVWLPYAEEYKTRLAFNDWCLTTNRLGGDIMFGNWFENYFLTVSKDIVNTDNHKKFWISQSDHSLQGQFLLNYKLQAVRVHKRRDIRIINREQVKKDVMTDGKILATPGYTNSKFINFSIIKRWSTTKDIGRKNSYDFSVKNPDIIK